MWEQENKSIINPKKETLTPEKAKQKILDIAGKVKDIPPEWMNKYVCEMANIIEQYNLGKQQLAEEKREERDKMINEKEIVSIFESAKPEWDLFSAYRMFINRVSRWSKYGTFL